MYLSIVIPHNFMRKKTLFFLVFFLLLGAIFIPSLSFTGLQSQYLEEVSSVDDISNTTYDTSSDATMQYDPITWYYIYVGSSGADTFAAQSYNIIELQEQQLSRLFLQEKEYLLEKQKFEEEANRIYKTIDFYQNQISQEQEKTKTLLEQYLDIYMCTKNKTYKNKWYVYSSVEAFDTRKNEIFSSLWSLPGVLATLRVQLKAIPTSRKTERSEKTKEIARISSEISKANAEYTIMTHAKVNSSCVYPARSITAQSKRRILELQSSSQYIQAISDYAQALSKTSDWSKKILETTTSIAAIEAQYGDSIREMQKRRSEKTKQDNADQKKSVCGNGSIEDGEICDDGNQDDDDYCSNACELGDKMQDYCEGENADMPCQKEMQNFQNTLALCKEKLDACEKNSNNEDICNESKIACQKDEAAQEEVRECIKDELQCLDKFFQHVRPGMQWEWEKTKESLEL